MGHINSQILIRQQSFRSLSTRETPINDTRFIIIGASIMLNTFSNIPEITNQINVLYPNRKVSFHNHAVNGATSTYTIGIIDDIMEQYDQLPFTDTYVIVTIGGNDVTNTRPWSEATTGEKNTIKNNIEYIIDAIEDKGFTPILNDLGFRNYDGNSYLDEENGVKPYNDNIIKPLILERSPQFAFNDGESFWQLYTVMYNNWETYLSNDDIHPNGTGYAAYRTAFVNTICKFLFTGIPPNKIPKEGNAVVDNMVQEQEYFDAYFLPIESKSSLQTALNTHNSVRLGQGDYSGTSITMSGDMKLYGHPTITKVPAITVSNADSLKIVNVKGGNITFSSSVDIENSTFKNLEDLIISGTGAIIENNEFINLSNVRMNIDNSTSGYLRNNKIIKHKIHGFWPQIRFKGNNTTPSYGNTQLWVNLLTPAGYAINHDNIAEIKMLGVDSETWNSSNQSPGTPNITMTNMGKVVINAIGGGNNGNSAYRTISYDIEADKFYLVGSFQDSKTTNNQVSGGDVLAIKRGSSGKDYDFDGSGYNLKIHNNNTDVYLNESINNAEITESGLVESISDMILGEELTPWELPTFDPLPNPTGSGWDAAREGQTDSQSYIQSLVDTYGIAELPEGIYYVGSTITLNSGDGIIGAGTGKTAIVAMTDDFDIITVTDTNTGGGERGVTFDVTNLTLQGGVSGIKVEMYGTGLVRWNYINLNNIIFRNMDNGIHLYRFFGIDNNFFEQLHFVNVGNGVFKDIGDYTATPGSTNPYMTYMDKTVFYDCQFINNSVALNFNTGRQDNLNAFINCNFDGNTKIANFKWEAQTFFANSIFKNSTGTNELMGGDSGMNFYGCKFENNNNISSLFRLREVIMEGCEVLDNKPLNANYTNNAYIINSKIKGTVGTFANGTFVNSTFDGDTTLNKLLVNYKSGTATVIIDEPSDPYPQYLVTQ